MLHYNTLRYVTLRYATLRYSKLHYITIHYITLHYNTYTFTPCLDRSATKENKKINRQSELDISNRQIFQKRAVHPDCATSQRLAFKGDLSTSQHCIAHGHLAGFHASRAYQLVNRAERILHAPCFHGSVFVGVLRIQKSGHLLVLAASRECSTCYTQKVISLPNS